MPRMLKGSRHCSGLDTDAATASASRQPNGYIKVREEVRKVANEQKRLAWTRMSVAV
jgi:hypothetical protein